MSQNSRLKRRLAYAIYLRDQATDERDTILAVLGAIDRAAEKADKARKEIPLMLRHACLLARHVLKEKGYR
jgi:hypothetical protein